jgi:hypothetical protein
MLVKKFERKNKVIQILGRKITIVAGTILRISNRTGELQANHMFNALDVQLKELLVKQMIVFKDLKDLGNTERYITADTEALNFICKKYKTIDKEWLFRSYLEIFKRDAYNAHMNHIRLREAAKKLGLLKRVDIQQDVESFWHNFDHGSYRHKVARPYVQPYSDDMIAEDLGDDLEIGI